MNQSNKILSEITVFNKYAKYVEDKGRRETWEELVTRNKEMHQRSYPQIKEEIEKAYEFVYTKKVLPSMRSLQFGGRPIEVANNRIYNCAFLPIDHIDGFSELMFLLLGGTGGGYSVQRLWVDKLPEVKGPLAETRRFLVGDSIEGWADAIKVLVEAYFLGKQDPVFDYRDIREKGAALITTGGKAPGPDPLEACINKLKENLANAKGRSLRPIEVHDLCCIIADAVLAGGIRRAALISLFDRDDEEMLRCKGKYAVKTISIEGYQAKVVYEGEHYTLWLGDNDLQLLKDEGVVNWYHFYPYRARANNSAVLPRGEVEREDFYQLMEKVKASGAGEPGIYWTSNEEWGTNPCCEIGLQPFQFC